MFFYVLSSRYCFYLYNGTGMVPNRSAAFTMFRSVGRLPRGYSLVSKSIVESEKGAKKQEIRFIHGEHETLYDGPGRMENPSNEAVKS